MAGKSEAGEHILVCLSPSPSNAKVIETAAKMADAFQATLTAIYVRPVTYESLPQGDKSRLQRNISLAEKYGAAVMTIIGDDIPAQVAEYAHISNTTKIVIGRSKVARRHIWSRPPLTEQLIVKAPDVDVYIIPDSSADFKQQRETFFFSDQIRPSIRELGITFAILTVSTGLGLLFRTFGFSESNIITVFILGVLVISAITVSPLFGALGSLASVLLFNWFFIDPKFSFHTYETEYSVTFAIMLASSLITGTLANRMKQNATHSAREAFRTKVLLDTSQLLQKAEDPARVLGTTAHQIQTLLSRDVAVYPRGEDGQLEDGCEFLSPWSREGSESPDANEKEIAGWVFLHQQSAGFHMDRYRGAKAQYHPICLNGYGYGVIAIRVNRAALEPYENSIVTSILGECALALENLRNAEEKRLSDLMVRKEQLRSNLLRSISHDIRTPLTSISGNASNLLYHYHQLDDETREQIFTDIYDDSEWLIDLVENLLSISRIENGQIQLHLSSEIMGDIIEEALRHIGRNASEHSITVRDAETILLVDVDARLIMQVLINLIDNAIKHTPAGSKICIETRQVGDRAVVTVRDDGPGISDEMKPHIFEMFYTGQNKVADGRRGLGLGLALCKTIVEAHHGTIRLYDNEPEGSCFEIALPIREVQIHEPSCCFGDGG